MPFFGMHACAHTHTKHHVYAAWEDSGLSCMSHMARSQQDTLEEEGPSELSSFSVLKSSPNSYTKNMLIIYFINLPIDSCNKYMLSQETRWVTEGQQGPGWGANMVHDSKSLN